MAVENIEGKNQALLDAQGKPIDADGNIIGWPARSGTLEIINGTRMVVKQLLIEIVIPSQATPVSQYNFADQPLLRNTALWGIEFYTNDAIPISPISKLGLVTPAMLGYMFLWMQEYSNSYNFFQNKPCIKFKTINNAGSAGSPFSNNTEGMIGQHVNWPNGYIIFSDPSIIQASTQFSILMDIYYSMYNNWQADGLGGSFGLR